MSATKKVSKTGTTRAQEAPAKTVDGYLASIPEQARAVLDRVRRVIKDAAPGGEEVVSYGILAYRHNGRILVYYSGSKEHYSLHPATDVLKESLGDEIAPYLSGKGTIHFELDKPVPAALIKKIVKVRMKENEALASRKKA
jgi:uncharacterized protein YdhG (YjbR/CyaY superfamily)